MLFKLSVFHDEATVLFFWFFFFELGAVGLNMNFLLFLEKSITLEKWQEFSG